MEEIMLEIIQKIRLEKEQSGKEPTHALFYRDISPAITLKVKESLNKLVKDKRVVWEPTINDDCFKILENEK